MHRIRSFGSPAGDLHWEALVERFKLFWESKGFVEPKKQKLHFLNSIPDNIYMMLRASLKQWLLTEPNLALKRNIGCWLKTLQRDCPSYGCNPQFLTTSNKSQVSRLQANAAACNFGDYLDTALLQLIAGIRDEILRISLLAVENLSGEQACKQAYAAEAAKMRSSEFVVSAQQGEDAVFARSHQRKKPPKHPLSKN